MDNAGVVRSSSVTAPISAKILKLNALFCSAMDLDVAHGAGLGPNLWVGRRATRLSGATIRAIK